MQEQFLQRDRQHHHIMQADNTKASINSHTVKDMPQEVRNFVSMVPKQYRRFLKEGVFIIPNHLLIPDYESKKQQYLTQIANTKTSSVNSLHKYTSPNPISAQDINHMHQAISQPLHCYHTLYLPQFANKHPPQSQPQLHASFAITYDPGHKGLTLHTDDSAYTVNLCLMSSAEGNEVVFNERATLEPIQDFAFIHSGKVPHSTNDLKAGTRTNVVLWFK